MNLHDLTVTRARRLLDDGSISAVELTEALLERILAVDNDVCAYLTLTPETALEQARAIDAGAYPGAPLRGIPLAIKDVLCTAGVPTTCASRMLENFVPPFDATAVARLKDAGAIVLGKTNCDEFAMGSSTENSAFFSTRNPWNLERVPGGSSGGSAAAVAAGECLAALGSDTGGSVRQPAALCGVVGLKPTYGRVSRYGRGASASSLDQGGLLARSVADAALLLSVVAGADPRDATCVDAPLPDCRLDGDVRGMRVGLARSGFGPGIDPAVEAAVRSALAQLAALGAELVEIDLPHGDYALPTYHLLAPAEASANLARYDGLRYGLRVDGADLPSTIAASRAAGFGAEVKRRIVLGTYTLSAGYYDAYYRKAQQVRTLIRRDFDAAFERVDAIATPTSPTSAFRLGERTADPLQMYRSDVLTLGANLAGVCALSVPCGFDDGLPVGLQWIGPAWGEATLLRLAHAYEQSTNWHTRRPPL